MPSSRQLVINTSPLIALIAALGDLSILQHLYDRVLVPWEVCQEMQAGGSRNFAIAEFNAATWLDKQLAPVSISPFLLNSLDRGEASVIQTALNLQIPLVCIDERAGRRIARLSGLLLTGSIGILLRAKREGQVSSISRSLQKMQERGIRLSSTIIQFALTEAGEI